MHVNAPPSVRELLAEIDTERVREVLASAYSGAAFDQYLHWDKLRHMKPPNGLTSREWWLVTKLSRGSALRNLPLTDSNGLNFEYAVPDQAQRYLHSIDQRCGGEIAMSEVVTTNDHARQHYLVNSLMEEAIRSSQLEGATTSRQAAKDLLQSGRPPRDRSERMILNNYLALQFMRDEIGDELTPEAVLHLHRILTEGTLDNPDAAGRLQHTGEERVAVLDATDGSVLHSPPPAEQLSDRLDALCRFANERDDKDGTFIHPVVRGILLHFWLGYDHPFEDGNGRTARALFYWYMRVRGYWLVEYLSISRILRKAPSQYARAYLFTETDERDTTYFILHQLGVIQRAVDELHEYLDRKVHEVRQVEKLMRGNSGFNHRQLALLGNALRDPGRIYTIPRHASTHNVTHETARQDFLSLENRGLISRERSGRSFVYSVTTNLPQALRGSA